MIGRYMEFTWLVCFCLILAYYTGLFVCSAVTAASDTAVRRCSLAILTQNQAQLKENISNCLSSEVKVGATLETLSDCH